MKKLLTLLCMMLILTACGSKQKEAPAEEPAKAQTEEAAAETKEEPAKEAETPAEEPKAEEAPKTDAYAEQAGLYILTSAKRGTEDFTESAVAGNACAEFYADVKRVGIFLGSTSLEIFDWDGVSTLVSLTDKKEATYKMDGDKLTISYEANGVPVICEFEKGEGTLNDMMIDAKRGNSAVAVPQ